MGYLLELQNLRDAAPDMINYLLLGISEAITIVGILIAAYIYWCTSKRAGAYILACFAVTHSAPLRYTAAQPYTGTKISFSWPLCR